MLETATLSSAVIRGVWEIFEMSHTELHAQHQLLKHMVEAADASHPEKGKWSEWMARIEEEMNERGVAHTIGCRLQALQSPPPPSQQDTNSTRAKEDGAQNDEATKGNASPPPLVTERKAWVSHHQFDDLIATRPPWFSEAGGGAVTTPTSLAGLWVDDGDDELSQSPQPPSGSCSANTASQREISVEDLQIIPPRRGIGKARRNKARVGVMNKLGFFIVPTRKKRAVKATVAPLPEVKTRKPPLPKRSPSVIANARTEPRPTVPVIDAEKRRKQSASPNPNANPRSSSSLRGTLLPPVRAQGAQLDVQQRRNRPLSATTTTSQRKPQLTEKRSTEKVADFTSQPARPATTEPSLHEEIVRSECSASVDHCDARKANFDDEATTTPDNQETEVKGNVDTTPVSSPLVCASLCGAATDSVVDGALDDETTPSQKSPRCDNHDESSERSVEGEAPKPLPSGSDSHRPPLRVVEPPSLSSTSIIPVAPVSLPPVVSCSTTNDTGPDDREVESSGPSGRTMSVSAAQQEVVSELKFQPPTLQSPREETAANLVGAPTSLPLPPPVCASLEAMMVDPSFFFTFDRQPPNVRRGALNLLQTTLRQWFCLSSNDDSVRKRGTLPPIAAATAADTEDLEEVIATLRRDRCKWYMVQTSHEEVYDLITSVLEAREDGDEGGDNEVWCEVPAAAKFFAAKDRKEGTPPPAAWSLWWTWGKPRVHTQSVWLHGAQFVNHIPKTWNLTRKDCLMHNIQRYCNTVKGRQTFGILPQSFQLPRDYVPFTQAFAELGGTWIMKQVGMSRGRGISLVSDISHVVYDSPVVLQRYIDRPLTIDGGFKFDLRIYVVVTSFQPVLEAFISRLGFARIASVPYKAPGKDASQSNKYAHLTNTSISGEAKRSGSQVPVGRLDTKWTLDALAAYMNRVADRSTSASRTSTAQPLSSWDAIWDSIKVCILKALICVEDTIPHAPCTFEVFGFDVMLDEDLRPWVLEVNASPSLEVDSSQDEAVKPRLIDDIITLLDIPMVDRWALLECVERRLGRSGVANDVTALPSGRGVGPKRVIPLPSKCKSLPSKRPAAAASSVSWAEEYRSIFGSWRPRAIGFEPVPDDKMGSFEMLAPSATAASIRKQKFAS